MPEAILRFLRRRSCRMLFNPDADRELGTIANP